MMRTLASVALFIVCYYNANSQITVDWNSFSFEDEKLNLTIEGVESILFLEKNKAVSKKQSLLHPSVKSLDLKNEDGAVIGKLTSNESYTFISIKAGSKLISQKWIDLEPIEQLKKTERMCGTENSPKYFGQNHIPENSSKSLFSNPESLNHGDEILEFRLAILGTGEFTEQNGGTAINAFTVALNTVNTINLIFENELSVSLILSESNFYTNENTDPFDPNGDSRTNQAAEAMAMNFNESDYDLGHVFHFTDFGTSWAGGGIAGLGVVCDNSTFFSTVGDSDGLTGPNKGAGWSGSFENTSIGWIRLSAHEFGHQFDALHTFNGNGSGNCVGGISSSSAYEIGSGTTLMSYEGLCSSSQNVPPSGENDNYFHSTSLDRMRNYLESADGNCAGVIPNSNAVPVASHAYAANPIIPIGTPFELEGTGTDTDNDNLTYLWEQIDEDGNGAPTQGFIGSAAANSAIAPLFKSVPPSETGFRVFPQLSHILQGENENQSFEALPQINREINFSFIVRDNAGGVNSTGLMVESSDSAGPFRVSSQNVATTWIADGNSTETIFWEVANTDNSIINCQTVDIWLSSDNGNNFDFPLAENVPNSGSFSFVIPNLNTSTGRIKIKASNNVFFDINDTSIIIESGCEANGTAFSPDADFMANTGDASLDLNLSPEYGSAISSFSGELTTADFGTSLAAGSGSCVNFNLNTTFADSYAFQVSEAGTYTFSKTSGAFGLLVHLYDGEFIPSSPCTNWVTGSFNVSTSMLENGISVDLLPGIDYTLVVGGFNATLPSSLPQTYSYSCSGPGNCVDGLLAPSGFSYTYIISDSDNVIVDINSDPDLTSFSGGIYTITGLSYDSSLNISSYMNANFSELENDLLSLVFCGNLSSNDLTVEILSADTCAGDFNFDGIITASDLTIFLSEFGCLEDCQADLNGDDIVTATDLTLMLSLFGTLCP